MSSAAVSTGLDTNKPQMMEETNGESKLKLSDPPKLHPLQNIWALWFFKNDRSKDWAENLKRVIECSTVEGFWGIYNHVQPPSKLANGCDYSLFKKGIEPMWEDAHNKKGGSWSITLDRSQRSSVLDEYWLTLLLLCIGELFGDSMDEVCGVTVNLRGKADRLSVWTTDVSHEAAIMHIGHTLKTQLKLTEPIHYNSHLDSQNKTGSKAKSLITL